MRVSELQSGLRVFLVHLRNSPDPSSTGYVLMCNESHCSMFRNEVYVENPTPKTLAPRP